MVASNLVHMPQQINEDINSEEVILDKYNIEDKLLYWIDYVNKPAFMALVKLNNQV